jgi:DNA-binding NarL/FixJ family response regulator
VKKSQHPADVQAWRKEHLKRVRAILADDHPAVLQTVAELLEGDIEVVETTGDGLSLLEAAMRLKPDVLIMDISMPLMSGIEAAKKLKDAGCASKIVFLTVHSDPDFVRACLSSGALAYVVKPRLATDLIPAIREALAGKIFVSPPLKGEA